MNANFIVVEQLHSWLCVIAFINSIYIFKLCQNTVSHSPLRFVILFVSFAQTSCQDGPQTKHHIYQLLRQWDAN